MAKPEFEKYNKDDVKLGDVYVFSYSFVYDDFRENSVVEIVLSEDNDLIAKPIRTGYWKPSYEHLPNDYLTDFEAVRVFRKH